MRLVAALLVLALLGIVQGAVMRQANLVHGRLTMAMTEESAGLPISAIRIMAIGYDGLLSDYTFLRALAFIGKSLEKKQTTFLSRLPFINEKDGKGRLTDSQWTWFARQLDITTDLDPWFADPYYLGNSELAWGAERYVDANRLLDKGVRHCYWDWSLPFYAGFNSFYFLGNKQGGASYLMIAASRPGAPGLLATLGARLAYEGNQTGHAIIFLRQIMRDATSAGEKAMVGERLAALEGIFAIEQGVEDYVRRFGVKPKTVEELLSTDILSALPKEPYGGRYYLDSTGQVKTTSELGKH